MVPDLPGLTTSFLILHTHTPSLTSLSSSRVSSPPPPLPALKTDSFNHVCRVWPISQVHIRLIDNQMVLICWRVPSDVSWCFASKRYLFFLISTFSSLPTTHHPLIPSLPKFVSTLIQSASHYQKSHCVASLPFQTFFNMTPALPNQIRLHAIVSSSRCLFAELKKEEEKKVRNMYT